MNLNFKDVQIVNRDGADFMLQRSDVTRDQRFWITWRSPAGQEALKKLIYINKEGATFYAYRLKSLQPEGPMYGTFNLSYQVKNLTGLLPYQPVAVSHIVQSIIDHGAACDGSDTGLGKTYQALGACRELGLKPLVICKKAGMAGWKRGCALLKIEPYLICNWEMARTGKIILNGHKPIIRRHVVILGAETNKYEFIWQPPKGTILIFDEAHLGFNQDSLNHALWTASKGITSISLSATFADRPARLKGLFQVLRIMEPALFDKWLLERGQYVNQYNNVEGLTDIDDMKSINKMLYPAHGYRISYDDEAVKAFFPERVIQTEIVTLADKDMAQQNKAYEELMVKAAKLKELGLQAQLMVADLRYRQHAELLKTKVLVEMAQELIDEGKQVVIFVNYRETLRYLAEMLNTRSMIFGDQDRYGVDREEVREDFQAGRTRIILCMVEAGGQSIDLHDVNGTGQRVSLICPTYNPITLQQVLGRTYRAKSRTTPIMKLVYAGGTVEEKVCEVVNRKLDNIAALNDGDLMEPDLFQLGVRV